MIVPLQEIHCFSAAYINFDDCELAGENNTRFSAARSGPAKITRKFRRLKPPSKSILLFSLAHPWPPNATLCSAVLFGFATENHKPSEITRVLVPPAPLPTLCLTCHRPNLSYTQLCPCATAIGASSTHAPPPPTPPPTSPLRPPPSHGSGAPPEAAAGSSGLTAPPLAPPPAAVPLSTGHHCLRLLRPLLRHPPAESEASVLLCIIYVNDFSCKSCKNT
jgi:hypothetical protein